MTLLVRDEADIIAANIEFHRAMGVDFFIVMDNRSVDETSEILHDYARQGLVHYIYQSEDDYAQHRWVTRMARIAATDYGADWVINNDADEFWWPERSDDLRDALSTLPAQAAAACAQRTNFIPREPPVDPFFANAMTVRDTASVNALGRPLPGKVCHRAHRDIVVEQGNHAVAVAGDRVTPVDLAVTILHFPMRSYAQFANKIAKGGAAYERNQDLDRGTGATWRHLYERFKRSELEDHYRSQVPSEAEVRDGLATGRYVVDERLKRFFAAHGAGSRHAAPPPGGF